MKAEQYVGTHKGTNRK